MPIHPDKRRRYPSDWAIRSRFVRTVRARNCCEWCGIPNGVYRNRQTGEWTRNPEQVDEWTMRDGDTVTRIVLTTAHIHDHRPEAASLLNLAALCQRCHLGHDRRHHLRNYHDNRDRRAGQAHLPGIMEATS